MVFQAQTQWKQISSDGLAFERPLGATEQGFYWDSAFNRTADLLRHAEIVVRAGDIDTILSRANLSHAWGVLKKRYPLLQATVEERIQDNVVFMVDPCRSLSDGQADVFLEVVHTPKEVDQKVDSLLNGRSPLSNTLLACVYILKRIDEPRRAHVLIHSAHYISDGAAHDTLMRELLQLLSDPNSIPPLPWTERVTLAVATETLPPYQDSCLPRARWRQAIGWVVMQNRRTKLFGGHTLPRTVTSKTLCTPARSCTASLSFSVQETQQILQTCRDNKLTFGSVLPVVGKLAMMRVLCSRYLQGKMSEAEWNFRKAEPMCNAGVVNLRPFMDSNWYTAGGAGNVSLSIGFYIYQTPAVPLGLAAGLAPGLSMPSHLDMLSKSRFFHCCRVVREKVTEYIRHPLYFNMNKAYTLDRVRRVRDIAVRWRGGQLEEEGEGPDQVPLSPEEEARAGYVTNHGGGTRGDLDKVLPSEYHSFNSSCGSQQTRIELLDVRSCLHCRPAELYLGASTFRQKLRFHLHWDGDVYDEEVVRHWLEQLMETARVYLCRPEI